MDEDAQGPIATADAPSAPPASPAASGNGAPANPSAAPTSPGSTEDLEARASANRQPAAALTPVPMVKPKRGGLGGVVDSLLDELAGTQGQPKLHQGEDGNYYVETPELSRKGQWLKIAGEALHGAAAGAAQMHGPNGAARGFAAGVEAGGKGIEQDRQQAAQTTQEARQANQDKFNSIKLQHDKAMWAFEEAHAQHQGTEDEIKFSQQQMERELKPAAEGGLGSVDLGVASNAAELADRMQKEHPDFWKQAYGGSLGRVVGYKEYSPDGTVTGQHFFARVPGVSQQFVPEDQAFIKIVTPGKTAEDRPTITQQKVTVPLTVGQQTAYNNAADNKLSEWDANQRKVEKEDTEEGLKKQQTRTSAAQEGKDRAETDKLRREQATEAPTDPALVDGIGTGSIAPTTLGRMLGGKQGQKVLADVAAKYPDLDTSKLASYPKTYLDYTSGKTGMQRQNLDTAFKAVEDLTKLNTYASRLPTGASRNAWDNRLNAASQEIANGLAKPGTAAREQDVKGVKENLSQIFSRQAAIDKQVDSLMDQYESMRDRWKEGAPSAHYEAKMPDVGPRTKGIMYNHNPQKAEQWFGKPAFASAPGKPKVLSYDGGQTWQPAQ